ncbi:VOC family protein [Nocardiopsis composta]|uniref:Putative lactoylglutathione lyase n=1 Tax=Nocardiopsis composta TaxID=157465 RepID=A0A7W8QQU5_9ACTN|nr:VOC family protein [Nocardiopsis composta]MBB5434902.1 putative lactoylglutathione lyase [Nocardiopsis composta]
MSKQIFVNLPVADLDRAKDFYTGLGYRLDPMFSDENAASFKISDEIYVMLLVHDFFKGVTDQAVADTATHREVINALSADSRAEVDALLDSALAAGATEPRQAQEEGPMYGRSFLDPDGHLWEVVYMDMEALEG